MFSKMGVNVVDSADAGTEDDGSYPEPEGETESAGEELVEVQQYKFPVKPTAPEPIARTNDPVRMYLREMGSVELLSREGEIAIAKRIEAGREAMIAGLCESPLTFQAIIIWRDEINEGGALLRDIIDLDATYAGPDAKTMPVTTAIGPNSQPAGAIIGALPVRAPALAPLPDRNQFKPAGTGIEDDETATGGTQNERDLDKDDMENWLSVAAIETELKPKVLESFNIVA
jgi:RNA polymerase primary sigma factor